MRSMILLFSLFTLGCLWLFVIEATTKSQPASQDDLAALRAEVRTIIRPSCGSCHTSTLPTAKPKAVAVFDLKNEDWSAGITPAQQKGFEKRLDKFSESEKVKIRKLLVEETWKQGTDSRRPETGDRKLETEHRE